MCAVPGGSLTVQTLRRRATTQWTRGTAVARKEKYPVSPYLEFRPHWKADFFLPEVTGWVPIRFGSSVGKHSPV